MRVLLDECIDRRLAAELAGHKTRTAPEMGWANWKNGELLSAAQHEFDAFITVDANLPYQQNVATYDIAILIVRAPSNRLDDLEQLVPELLRALPSAPKRRVTIVS